MRSHYVLSFFFFFNDTATTEIYTLSLHDALPICYAGRSRFTTWLYQVTRNAAIGFGRRLASGLDRKSTRLNSSHSQISYAVFCLKKKKNMQFAADTLDSRQNNYALSNRDDE